MRCKPATQRKVVDFGQKCGKREVFLYNLPEAGGLLKTSTRPTSNRLFLILTSV